MKKIVVAGGFGLAEEALAVMQDAARVTVLSDDSEAALLAEVRDADSLLVSIRPAISRRFIESAGRLRHIARSGVGVDIIDVQAATEHGIFVTNVPEVTADSVAEFTMTLLLSLAKNIVRCDRAVKEGRWVERSDLIHENIELSGKTHGIVGLGNIGRRVAIRCRAFGMRVLYYKRNRDPEIEQSAGVEYAPLEILLSESDSISLHLPLTKETTNLIDKSRFESMKRTALLINRPGARWWTKRPWSGRSGKEESEVMLPTVYAQEPPDPKSELLRFRNVVATPHLGGGTREARLRANMTVAEEVLSAQSHPRRNTEESGEQEGPGEKAALANHSAVWGEPPRWVRKSIPNDFVYKIVKTIMKNSAEIRKSFKFFDLLDYDHFKDGITDSVRHPAAKQGL